jgi:spore coat protein H
VPHRPVRFCRRVWSHATAFAVMGFALGALYARADEPKKLLAPPKDAKELYNTTSVWTVHLTFAADQWAKIEPKRNANPGGAFGRGNGPSASARAAELFTPVVMSLGDTDRDGKLSADEFAALGRTWFKAWDKEGTGKLTEPQFRAGFDTLRSPLAAGGIPLIGAEGKRNGISSTMLGIDFEFVHADLDFEGQVLKDVAVRYKGNGTFFELGNNPKRSFKISLDKHTKGQTLAGVTTLNLQNNITDASWMNEALAYRLFRDAGVPTPRTAYARVSVTVPGLHDRKYFGLYSLSENVDNEFVQANFGTTKGAVFKPVTPLLFADLGADWSAYNQMYDPKSKLTDEQKKAVAELCRLVSQADDKQFAARIGEHIDLSEFARYMAVLVYLSDIDGILGPGQNLYLHWHPDAKKFVFIPWDMDRAWGQFARATQKQRDELSIHRPWQGEKPFFERMFKVEAFKKEYLKHLEEFAKTLFQPDRITKQVDEIAAVIRPAIKDEPVSSIDRFELAVAGKMIPPIRRGFGGGGDTQPIKPFVKVRTQSILDQLAGKSDGQTLGGGAPGRPGGGRNELASAVRDPLYRLVNPETKPSISEAELAQGFERLFKTWDAGKGGILSYSQLRSAMEKSFSK